MSSLKRLIRENIIRKKSNICVSLDFNDANKIINTLNIIKDHIIMIKIHVDIIDNFDNKFIEKLVSLCKKNNILIFEDRKFADIGYIFKQQFCNGIYKINTWANIISVHSIVGSGIIEEFNKCKQKDQGILLISEMSNRNNLFNENYIEKTIKIAQTYEESVIGFICQKKISNDSFLYLTPGISLNSKNDNSDQQYITPEKAINNGTDIIIVGRGIIKSGNILESCIKYKDIFYNLYKNRYNI